MVDLIRLRLRYGGRGRARTGHLPDGHRDALPNELK